MWRIQRLNWKRTSNAKKCEEHYNNGCRIGIGSLRETATARTELLCSSESGMCAGAARRDPSDCMGTRMKNSWILVDFGSLFWINWRVSKNSIIFFEPQNTYIPLFCSPSDFDLLETSCDLRYPHTYFAKNRSRVLLLCGFRSYGEAGFRGDCVLYFDYLGGSRRQNAFSSIGWAYRTSWYHNSSCFVGQNW